MNPTLNELFTQAQKLQYEGAIAKAQELYQRILEQDSQHSESLHCLGLLYAQTGAMDKALNYLEQAVHIAPTATLLNNLANAYKRANRVTKAIDTYQKAINLEPDYALAHNNIASLYAQQNEYNNALQHYIKATHAAPDFTAAHFNLGLLLLKNYELEAAKTQFNNVITLNPHAVEAQFYLGVLALDQNELSEAEQAFMQVLEQESEHVHALVNLGVIALKNGRDQLAIDYFTKALALDNEELDARNNLAATFMHHDRFENALMHYDVLLQKDPDNQEYLYNSGVAQMALGHLNEATLHFEQLIELEPTHTAALNNLAAVCLKLEDRAKAQRYLEAALHINPQDTISQHMLNALLGIKDSVHTPEYARNLFNNYALYYEQHMQGLLKYTLPTHIGRTLHELALFNVNQTLDLGCGTGLTGIVLREASKQLIGVDIADKMLTHAAQKKIYDELIASELLAFLEKDLRQYDLIVAADVLPYFADLEPLFALVSAHLLEKHYFIFTTEINPTEPGWQLEHSARFSHAPEYIKQLAQQYQLVITRKETVPARLQNNTPLSVLLYTLQKQTI